MKTSGNFDEARALHSALMQVFVAHPGGGDADALARVTSLCEAAAQAVDDLECRCAIGAVQHYASLLYADEGSEGIQFGMLRGAQALRFRALNALSAFRGRLNVLETRPRSVPELPALGAQSEQRVTAYGRDKDRARSRDCGFERHLVKPVDPKVLLEQLEGAKRH